MTSHGHHMGNNQMALIMVNIITKEYLVHNPQHIIWPSITLQNRVANLCGSHLSYNILHSILVPRIGKLQVS